jgi:hypothetical protein
MSRRTHGHVAELCLPVSANGIDGEINFLVKYDFYPGAPAHTPRGEYAPIDPPEAPEIDLNDLCVESWLAGQPVWRTATADEWADYAETLVDENFDYLCQNAREDDDRG